MTPEQRQLLVQREADRAKQHLSQSEEMLALGHWDLAANRQYYACYHATQALFVHNGINGTTHKGMIAQFSLKFVKTGIVDIQYGSFLTRLMQLRLKADYNCYYDISETEVRSLTEPTRDFVDTILALIDN